MYTAIFFISPIFHCLYTVVVLYIHCTVHIIFPSYTLLLCSVLCDSCAHCAIKWCWVPLVSFTTARFCYIGLGKNDVIRWLSLKNGCKCSFFIIFFLFFAPRGTVIHIDLVDHECKICRIQTQDRCPLAWPMSHHIPTYCTIPTGLHFTKIFSIQLSLKLFLYYFWGFWIF